MRSIVFYCSGLAFFFFCRFFFFKQKTAYEMRISDWSSDVCSSDLHLRQTPAQDRTYTLKTFNSTLQKIRLQSSRPERQMEIINNSPMIKARKNPKIGRASCRERVSQYV